MSSQNASASYSATMSSMSPPPPVDLGTYARSMHQHTKRQMDLIADLTRSSSQNNDEQSTTGAMPNGVSNNRRNPSHYGYQS
ncbi:hypothetical protein QBC35DRAFT_451517 [Podospora australis]|uniref:Uncharacterized protein n=1 Tax=Podospora australis TaxID=1536484 RepID=A0AAN7AGY0_9PEZI|nr:hypothetical protein QBC35DRAFT_451517 [Podospora australis]